MYVCLQNTLKLFIFTIIKIKTTTNKILQVCIYYLPSKRVQLHYYHSPFCIHKNKIISKRHFLNHISISVLSTGKINLFYTLPIQYDMYQFIFYICVNQFSCTFFYNCIIILYVIYSILELALVRYNGACPKNAVKFNNKILLKSSKKEERRILSFISISYHTRRIFFMLCNKRSSFEGQCVNEKSFNI